MMRKTSVYLSPRLKAALAARARATGRSEAEVIRAALEAEVREDGAGPGSVGSGPGSVVSGLASGARRPGSAAGAATFEAPVPGRLVGIGVGPGDADLLTVRAGVALRRADRIVAPATAVDAVGRAEAVVRQAVPGLRVERIPFAMAPGRAERDRSVDEAARVVAGYLDAGEEVAFVTLGDPLTYSTFTSVASAVRERRPATVVDQVPGIMAFQALAARTGTTVTDERQRLVVRTALDGEDVDVDLAQPDVTVVLYKGGRRLPDLAKAAAAAGRLPGAVAGELLGMPGERIGPLADLAADGPASYLATVIVPARSSPAPEHP
ncbi:MAG: precorrin-2/cobalt-factor-2 C20-methyltransferase [Actinomycetota bacterium]|nr:precorrin-2/cobalt-factor-2 C20-methyltransferase [Actinomycetota bacterium]